MVTITQVSEGTCIWCTQRTEGVEAEFQDGLRGFLCWKHLKQAASVRSRGAAAPKNGEGSSGKASPRVAGINGDAAK